MWRQLRPALMSVAVTMVVFGIGFPLGLTALGRVVFPDQARGSLVVRNGKVIGSRLIGQAFTQPGYFHPRPSAAGAGYDADASAGTNLGPTSAKLVEGVHNKLPDGRDDPGNFDGIRDLVRRYREENGLAADAAVPADAVTRSGSGLDPDITPANALIQAPRVARARGLDPAVVRRMVESHVTGRSLGLLGEPRVNVLELNLALDALPGAPQRR